MSKAAVLRFLQLAPAERILFFRAVFFLPIIAWAIRVLGVRKTQAWLERHGNRSERAREVKPRGLEISTLARAVNAASSYGPARGNCLSRSLLLWYLLRRSGYDSRLSFGGRRIGESFEAHAWVEVDGNPVNDQEDLRSLFTPFVTSVIQEVSREK